jgi:hypothetical protein
MSSQHNKDNHFKYPQAFVSASKKYIIVREVWAGVMNGQIQVEYPVGNLLFHADFVQDKFLGSYVCLTNSPNMKKKKFRIVGGDLGFNVAFSTIAGNNLIPDSWVFDFLLKWQN